MMEQQGERWLFTVNSPRSERVFLVQRSGEGTSLWHEMSRQGPGQFRLEQLLLPGRHRFHYFISEGGTYINCGSEGLLGSRVSDRNPTVEVEPFEMAMTA